jgi:hypothetical protein
VPVLVQGLQGQAQGLVLVQGLVLEQERVPVLVQGLVQGLVRVRAQVLVQGLVRVRAQVLEQERADSPASRFQWSNLRSYQPRPSNHP